MSVLIFFNPAWTKEAQMFSSCCWSGSQSLSLSWQQTLYSGRKCCWFLQHLKFKVISYFKKSNESENYSQKIKRSQINDKNKRAQGNYWRHFDAHWGLCLSEEGEYMWTGGTIFTLCSSTFTQFWSTKISALQKHALLYVSFIQRPIHFSSKSYSLSFVFLCYAYFSTLLFYNVRRTF